MKMGQKDTWMKVVMTPSPEICTRQGEYADTAFLQVKQIVEPEFSIWSEDTLACANDEIYLEARWKNAGEHPKFQWTRSIGEPYWTSEPNIMPRRYWMKTTYGSKCVLTPSDEVCFRQDTVFVGAKQIKVIKDPAVVISPTSKIKCRETKSSSNRILRKCRSRIRLIPGMSII